MSRSMKDSGVAYLGEIGSDFDVKPINSLFAIKKDIIGHEPDLVLSITQNGIKPKDIESNEGQIAASYANYQIVNVGDFAMNHMDLITGGVDISKYEGVTSPDYRVFVLKEKEMIDKFFLYVFQSYYKTRTFFGFGQGVANLGRWRLPASNFKNILIPITTAENQMKIVEVLDKKCSEIDTLIANQHNQIEKLKQYKQSLITEVVTKGLNPDVEMKDSGIKAWGNISENANLIQIRYVAKLNGRIGFRGYTQNDLVLEGEGAITLSPSNMKEMKMVYDKCAYLSWEKYEESPEIKIYNGDVLFVKTGSTYGKCSYVDNLPMEATINPQILVFKEIKINAKYFMYCLQTNAVKDLVECAVVGGTIPTIAQDKIGRFIIPFYSEKESEEIVSFLDENCNKIDSLIAIKQQKMEKLNQYKKSIIYEYVTGKKEA